MQRAWLRRCSARLAQDPTITQCLHGAPGFSIVARRSASSKILDAHRNLPITARTRTPKTAYHAHSPRSRDPIKPAKHLPLQLHAFRSTATATTTTPAAQSDHPTTYKPPTTGLLSLLPSALVPYAELSRIDKPAGSVYLFFPCAFSTFLAAPLALPAATPTDLLSTTALFLAGAVIMRGAGCTVNDLWDRNLDPHVSRTRLRPIARRAVTPAQGLAWAATQCLAGLAVLVQFPASCLWYGVPSLLLVGTYPLAKRVTYYPQVVLGLAFSWGAFMGFPAVGVDLLSDPFATGAAVSLYGSCIAWTVLYDMIYAHMDIKDDVKAGIKSIALAHETNTKTVLTGLGVVQIALLATAGTMAGAGPIFFVGSCGGAAITLATMIWRVQLKSVSSCWWWFRNGCYFTGGVIVAGLAGDYLARRPQLEDLDIPQ